MKAASSVLLSVAVFLSPLPSGAEEVVEPGLLPQAAAYQPSRMIKMRPDEKRSLALKANERNPYARRSPQEESLNENGESEEEISIRRTLSSLSVTGRSRGPQGLRVLLGDIILEKGGVLPQLLEEQSMNLQVMEVGEDSVLFGWLDSETGEFSGKTVQMTYDLTPSVNYALHGQGQREEGALASDLAVRRMGVLRPHQDSTAAKPGMATTPEPSQVSREVYEADQ